MGIMISDKKIMSFIIDFMIENTYSPSVREICEGVGLSSTSSVSNRLKSLEEAGKLTTKDNCPRTIVPTGYVFTKSKM